MSASSNTINNSAFQQANHGQDNKNWQLYLQTLNKREVYEKRVAHFFEWRKTKGDGDEPSDLIRYFQYFHGDLDEQPPHKYAPTTLRQWHSIFTQFWKFTGRGDMSDGVTGIPVLDRFVTSWENGYQPEQAGTFTREQLVEFYSAPNTPEILVYKVYAVLSLGFAARGADVFLVPFAAVLKLTDHAKNEDGACNAADRCYGKYNEQQQLNGRNDKVYMYVIISCIESSS